MADMTASRQIPFGQWVTAFLLALWDVALVCLLATPVALGWCAGFLVRVAMYAWAAAADGYSKGRGNPWDS